MKIRKNAGRYVCGAIAGLAFAGSSVLAQTEVFPRETMGTVAGTTTIAAHETANGFVNVALTMSNGAAASPADVRATSVSSGYTNSNLAVASGSANVFFTGTAGDYGFSIQDINAASYNTMSLEFGYRKESALTNATFVTQWSTNAGATWANLTVTGLPADNAAAGWRLLSASVPDEAAAPGLSLRWVKSGAQSMRIDDVLLRGTSSGPVPTNVSFTASSASAGEASGTYMITVTKSVASGNVSGQIMLGGTATEGGGNDYTVDTTNFVMNGATTSATFVVTINNDGDAEPTETVTLTLNNVVGGDISSPSVFTLSITDDDTLSSLIISQYTETDTGSTPKGIELWNVSGGGITFDNGANQLVVNWGNNGAALTPLVTITSGTVAAGGVFVIGTTDMSPNHDFTFTFNGDDALSISLGGVTQDVFGQPGVDPGASWDGNGVSTANQNIELKSGITIGDLDGWADPSERFTNIAVGSVLTGFGVAPGGSPPTNVLFTASAAAVGEASGTYTVTVTKSLAAGNISGQVVLSGDATLGGGNDYTIDTTNFTMNGATVTADLIITINNDVDTEAPETIVLTLANVDGGTIASPSVFTLTINDNDAVPEGISAFRFTATPHLQVTTKDANISVSDFALSSGTIETDQTTGDYFTNEPYVSESGGWTTDNQEAAKNFQFTITPASGYQVSITGISFRAYATGTGPSAMGYNINSGAVVFAQNFTNDTLIVVSNGVTGVVGVTSAIPVLIQGWTNNTRPTSGGGTFRIDDVIVFGTVSLVGGGGDTTIDEYDVDKFSLSGGTFSVTLSASSNGVPYTLIYTTNLLKNPPPVGNGTADTQNGNGGMLILQDTSPSDSSRYYWIKSNN